MEHPVGSHCQFLGVRRAACGGEEAHGFPVTAVERKGDPHSLAIVAADLEAIGTPAPITFIDRDAAVMPAHGTAGMAIEQKAMDLHHPVDPLVVRGLQTRGQRLALEDGVNAPVAVGRQFGDRREPT